MNGKQITQGPIGRMRVRDRKKIAEFVARIDDVMTKSRLTLEELGEAMGGYSKDSIWRLRSGQSIQITLDLLVSLARWASRQGYSLNWLFFGEGEMVTPPPKAGCSPMPFSWRSPARLAWRFSFVWHSALSI